MFKYLYPWRFFVLLITVGIFVWGMAFAVTHPTHFAPESVTLLPILGTIFLVYLTGYYDK